MAKSCQCTPERQRGPPCKFFQRGSKIGLNFSIFAPMTLALVGIAPWNFATWRALRWAWSLMYKFWGPAPQKFGRAKNSKIQPDFGHLSTLTVNFSKTGQDIKNRKQTWMTPIPAGFNKRNLVNFGLPTKKLQVQMLTHPKSTMHVLRMLMHLTVSHVTLLPRKFCTPRINPQSDLESRADSRWALPQISASPYLSISINFGAIRSWNLCRSLKSPKNP